MFWARPPALAPRALHGLRRARAVAMPRAPAECRNLAASIVGEKCTGALALLIASVLAFFTISGLGSRSSQCLFNSLSTTLQTLSRYLTA